MGEMAELAAAEYYADLAGNQKYVKINTDPFKTENVLNRDTWVDAQGTLHELKDLDRDHLQNILFFIYKRRDRYWLNCKDITMVEKFKDGDEFFQNVIRNSTIWKSIINELQKPSEGFNFGFSVPGEEKFNG